MTAPKKPQEKAQPERPPKNALSISALADKFDIPDRSTVRKRLKGVPPAWVGPKLKLYRLNDKNKAGKTVKELLEADEEDPKLKEAKTRKLIAEAQRAEYRLEIEQGNTFTRAEVKQHAFEFMSAMYKRFVKINPRQTAPRVFKAKTVTEAQRIMETDASLVFQELKRDYPAIFGDN